jgi:hypothetical protein
MEEEQGTSTSSALFTAVLVHPHSSLALNGSVKLMESQRGPQPIDNRHSMYAWLSRYVPKVPQARRVDVRPLHVLRTSRAPK